MCEVPLCLSRRAPLFRNFSHQERPVIMIFSLRNSLKHALLLSALGLLAAPAASASALAHTWVSGTGADSGPCSRAAPCQTFQYALSQTAVGGILSVVDAGDYGAATITQAVTIDGAGANASIAVGSGAAITINAPAGAAVTLRHLTLTGTGGASGGQIGIAYNTGGPLTVEDCEADNFAVNGIDLAGPGPALLTHSKFLNDAQRGVYVDEGGPALTSIRDATISGSGIGLYTCAGTTDISRSLVSQNRSNSLARFYGIFADMGSTISVSGCTVSGNGVGLRAAPNCLIRLSDNDIWNNDQGIDSTGNQNEPGVGTYSTAQNNRKAGNATPGMPTPGRTIVVQ